MDRIAGKRGARKHGAAHSHKGGGRDAGYGESLSIKETRLDIFIVVVLLCFGIYHSILYFGHQIVPNPDFTGFVNSGRCILSFRLPGSYKRAPVLGMLQVILSIFVGGQHPELTAGWLLNAILHPLNVLLLYLVYKQIVGKSAVWLAIIAIINGWVIKMLTEPIAETTLLFFILLSFYFIFRRSRWAYVFASAASMVRNEAVLLIFAAFLMDMVHGENKRQRLAAFGCAAAASVPIGLWMLATYINWQSLGSTHYLKELGYGGTLVEKLTEYLKTIWEVTFYPFFFPIPKASKPAMELLLKLSKIFVAASFVFGTVYGLFKRQWKMIALLAFLVPVFFIHSVQPVVVQRYCIPIQWIILLICVYGLQMAWRLLNNGGRIPSPLILLLQFVAMIVCLIWLVSLATYLPRLVVISRQSASMPYVAAGVAVAVFVVGRLAYSARHCLSDLTILFLVGLIIVSNQFILVHIVRNGERDAEFKLLADWYVANAEPGEKLVSTMSNILNIFAPAHKDSFVHMSNIEAESPEEFVKKCYEKGISYVTWDSRIGVFTRDRYYRYWGMKNIAMLARREDFGPYEFVTQIRANELKFINVFRLRKR